MCELIQSTRLDIRRRCITPHRSEDIRCRNIFVGFSSECREESKKSSHNVAVMLGHCLRRDNVTATVCERVFLIVGRRL